MTNDDTPTLRSQPGDAPTRGGFAAGQVVFARYTLEAQVGRGGMGVVWRARDEKLDRLVALKFLPPEVAADAEAVRELKLETRRCLDLTHANIVRVYDFIEGTEGAAIAMEYVEGESLARVKANAPGGCVAAGDLTPLVAQLCAALRYAHQVARVAHHDLKPANVLLTASGVLKITDFGIARSLSDTHTRLTSKIGHTSGTLHYMSPQQLTGEKPTVADDIYALGVVLYELLTGKPPFFRGDAFNVRQQILERAPAALEAHRADVGCNGPEIPAPWAETILACLAKHPKERPATADEVAARLGLTLEPMPTALSAMPFGTAAGRTKDAIAAPPPLRRSLVPWLVGVGGALLALAGAGIYYGIYAPEQARLAAQAERAHQAELALQAERARLAEEKRKAAEELAQQERKREEAARVQLAKDQDAYTAIMARIAALADTAPQDQMVKTRQAVRAYLDAAPVAFRDQVQKAWNGRQSALNALEREKEKASRPGSLKVVTDPPGATVVLYPRNERTTTPALFREIKPGDVTLHLEKEGFESQDIGVVVVAGSDKELPPIQLKAIYGSIAITSNPPDIYVLVEGGGKRLEGRTPFTPTMLPPGEYQITFRKPNWGWHPRIRKITVERGKQARFAEDMRGYALAIYSDPDGAKLNIDGQEFGSIPGLKTADAEPRSYVIKASLDGYQDRTATFNLTHNDVFVVKLTETPLHRELRRLVGVHWVYNSFGTDAELRFDLQGGITGTHRSVLGSTVRDAGNVHTFNPKLNAIMARFPANQAKSLYAGNVQITLVDDDHLAVSWTAGGSNERMVFERDKTQK